MLKKLLTTLALSLMATLAWAEEYRAGEHYFELPFPVKTVAEDKIEVTEAFGYLCPHCNTFEPLLAEWRKQQADDVTFVGLPVVFGRSWEPLARAYYVAELSNKVEESHQAMFDAIHLQRQRFTGPKALADFYAPLGIEPEKFNKLYDSFAVNMKLKQGDSRLRSYEITGVPAMVVNGKYRVTAQSAGGHKQMLEVVDYLVQQERNGN
ncbi:thiol:disulfide interchange protein DsbA/DsbL [Marinobacterium sediminicola]|uniref:Thiol:disulfide interchange protein n=1 Tax=Marinobacterium sediminicola TaxID=518898 RepID=A0ABY1S322_9GAMM|nr:thiol:disulfide interchange protein DsbA/DsbL [Marinobacterium sediminicola]ULG69312.1 thiol:disulfide interchange protein DsbA/DsbL [Marinobacterium sediminicola]SMR77663.1 thiol:disulfide interchange protein DsbA [Marinobacterium sediminicola]